MRPAELHWLAGLMEGEGSFFPGPPSAPHLPVMALSMTDEDVVRRVGVLLDRRVHSITPRRAHWRTTYVVRIRGSGAVLWMRRLRPLMGARRRAQIDRALATYEVLSNVKLTDDMAVEALDLLATGETVKAVAERFGVTVWCIYDLRLGRTHRHLGRR